jgi:hypothetical protein
MDDAELMAMKVIYDALAPLDEAARKRTMTWAASRLEIEPGKASHSGTSPKATIDGGSDFADVAALVDAARPSDGNDYALAIAYWLQVVEGREGWSGNEVNSQLKNLGHGLSNVTATLGRLRKRKPSLVMQTAKSGRSAQARKTYKLTAAGIREVQAMVAGNASEDKS